MLLFAYGVIHGGSDAQILEDGAASLNMGQTYIMTMIPAIFDNLGQALSLTTKVAEMAGKVGRAANIFSVSTLSAVPPHRVPPSLSRSLAGRGFSASTRPAKDRPNCSIAR